MKESIECDSCKQLVDIVWKYLESNYTCEIFLENFQTLFGFLVFSRPFNGIHYSVQFPCKTFFSRVSCLPSTQYSPTLWQVTKQICNRKRSNSQMTTTWNLPNFGVPHADADNSIEK